MRNLYIPLLLLFIISFSSCDPENSEDNEPEAEDIIEIPDVHFKNALLNTNSIDTNGDKVGDSDIDLNNDGKIQRSEAELIEGLIIKFDPSVIRENIDITGIENFINLKYIKITGFSSHSVDETIPCNFYSYDLSPLKKLEYLELNNLATNLIKMLNLSGLTNLLELVLINDKPTYNGFTPENLFLPVNYMDVNLEGAVSLASMDITNSFLNLDFCQVPSLKRLNMFYLEGGEPEVFDFHCLTKLEWLNIGENRIKTLILKNSSVLNTFLANDIGDGQEGWANYPYIEYICIDDFPEEFEQIAPLRNENTVVVIDCEF